jgi:hypothetical protein
LTRRESSSQFNGGLGGAPIQDPSIFGIDFGVGSGHSYPHLSFGRSTDT